MPAKKPENRPDWASELRGHRDGLEWTGEMMARKLGLPDSTYRNLEIGNAGPKVMSADLVKRLGDVIGAEAAAAIYQGWRRDRPISPAGSAGEDVAVLLPAVLQRGLAEARVTRFHPSRRYYQLNRDGRGSIADYISQAGQSVEMISINLATGHDIEMLANTFESLIAERRPPVRVRISLLDPELDYLAKAISPVISTSPETLRRRVVDTIGVLEKLKQNRLARARREYLEVWCHNCLPNGSAIIIDGDLDSGLFQLETKAYNTGMDKSFGFEVAAGSEFFSTLKDSYRRLMDDGRRVV